MANDDNNPQMRSAERQRAIADEDRLEEVVQDGDIQHTLKVEEQQAQEPAAQPEKPQKVLQGPQDSAREAIAQKLAKKAHHGKVTPWGGDMNDPRLYYTKDAVDGAEKGAPGTLESPEPGDDDLEMEARRRAQTAGTDQAETEGEGQQAEGLVRASQELQQERTDEQTYEVIVDGRREYWTLDQMRANVAKNRAADQRLEHATHVLREANETARALAQRAQALPQTGAPQQPTTPENRGQSPASRDAATRAPVIDRTKGVEIADKLMMGDEEERVQALNDFAETVRQAAPAAPPIDVEAHVQAALDRGRQQDAVLSFVQDFGAEPLRDPHMLAEITQATTEEMIQDIMDLGLPEQQFVAVMNRLGTPERLKDFHARCRQQGIAFRDPATILRTGYERAQNNIRQKFQHFFPDAQGQQPQSRQRSQNQMVEERRQMKRGLPNQPALRNQPRIPAPPPPARTPPSNVIAEMRRARGQMT